MNSVRTALYVSTAVVALALGGYLAGLFGPRSSETPAPPSSASAPTAPSAPAASAPPAAPTADGTSAGAPEKPSDAGGAPPAQPLAPSFDVVRVEPDGSLIIAGKAAANAAIEIIAGTPVLGSAKAGPEGDFAAVLDQPLKPGNYEIVLRATDEKGVVTMSTETAIVSIPENKSGDVLALVEEPGAPSRLITVPEPQQPATEAAPPAAGTGSPAAEVSAAPAAPAEAPQAGGTQESAAAQPAEAPSSPETPAASVPPATEKAPEIAAVPPQEQPGSPDKEQKVLDTVAIEAVEIEGRQIFVAGRANAGSIVRVYANETLLGQSKASDAARFLVEAERDLPVGDYIIRADMLASDASTVVARAAVPFTREEGEFIAAVAPPAGSPAPADAPGAETGGEAAATTPVPSESAPGAASSPALASPDAGSVEQRTAAGAAPAGSTAPATGADGASTPFLKPAEPAAPDTASGAGTTAPTAEIRPLPQPPTELAPKLQAVRSAVIIRRGDSLWRISRRVYGRGIRYSTIYLANQDQIEDPDRIWPGQVFKVPGTSSDGEAADMSRIGDQAVEQN